MEEFSRGNEIEIFSLHASTWILENFGGTFKPTPNLNFLNFTRAIVKFCEYFQTKCFLNCFISIFLAMGQNRQ